MSNDCLLIIFVKNIRPGKVKTRLAATIGDEKALVVYKKLLKLTRGAARGTFADKQVWYSEFIDEGDHFESDVFQKRLQRGENLGERMQTAVSDAYQSGYKRVIVIGSDCPDIDGGLLNEAFEKLKSTDVILGPSVDGGYYLIGFSKPTPGVFRDVAWSTPQVLSQTRTILEKAHIEWLELRVLNDVDTEEDLKSNRFLNE